MSRRNLIIIVIAVIVVFIWMGLFSKKEKTIRDEGAIEGPKVSVQELYDQAVMYKKEGEMVKAKETYQRILSEFSNFNDIETVQKELENVNMQIIFSNVPTEKSVTHEVVSGDTLGALSKRYGTTIELIKISNNLKSNVIRLGQRLRIWTGTFNIFVDKSQNILILKDEEEVIKVYAVSTGENNSTPVGEFSITSKLEDPVWFNRGAIVPPESPENVLGSRWLGFDMKGYGIHGTVDPDTIGQQVTAGCVRMRNGEVEELYSIVPTGTQVLVVN